MQLEISRMLYLIHAYYPYEECIKFFSPVATQDVGFSEFVRLNHTKYRTVGEMAAAYNMSVQQFANHFRKVFGEAPREWLQREKAHTIYRDICRSDKSLKEIALEYDFLQSNFIRYCRTKFGASPGSIRARLLGGESGPGRDKRWSSDQNQGDKAIIP
jgi:AraC-like DNA-binding protein